MYLIRFDMRAPAFGAATTDLYAAAIDMSSWAEQHGCLAAVLCEHHGSEDGYLPSPLILAAAIAARTERLMLSLVVILPFYDPVRLAEEIAVLDIISKGRASWLPGESVVHKGRRIKVTPSSHTPGGPALMWGGASLAAARRAGRNGLGMLANGSVPGMQEAYEAACREHGHTPGPVLVPERDTPSVTFVADDVDAAWDELGEFLLHDARGYAKWNPDNDVSAGVSAARDVTELRDKFKSHRIIQTSQAIDFVRRGGMLNLSPLCGGVPPDVAWPYLKRVGDVVLSEAAGSSTADGLTVAFNDLINTKGA
jgi:alkanesulfonate monooxygenase SsuD/methylene tetrahydromethanopterin reductase-like flavin-dependent oxidoreductase (luciferase family)